MASRLEYTGSGVEALISKRYPNLPIFRRNALVYFLELNSGGDLVYHQSSFQAGVAKWQTQQTQNLPVATP